jgi:tetratricopeptide (TPR) repeat protein
MHKSAGWFVALGLFIGAPALGVPTPEPAANNSEQMVQSYYQDFFNRNFDTALSDIKDLQPDASNPVAQAIVAAMRASALLGLKRQADARPLIAQIDQLSPDDSTARSTLFEGAIVTGDFDVAADSIDILIARFPDSARDLDWDMVRFFLGHEPKGQDQRNEDRRINLARIGYNGGDSVIGQWRVVDAVKILAGRGDNKPAIELLKRVNQPDAIENMLIQKRYAALWPVLEEIGGKHLAKARSAALAGAEQAYAAAPYDNEKLQVYVDALRHAGRFDDAIALRSKLPSTPQAMAVADEKTGWVVNSIAYALNEAGRGDEGDRLFAALNDPPRTDAGWRVSMIINRLEMLVMAGKFEKAATLLDVTAESATKNGNPYAQQLVRRLRYCVLSSVGRKDEAAKVRPEMLAHADDALQPTIDGLLCAGDTDEAAQLVLKALKNPDKAKREVFEEQLVHALQPVPLMGDDPSVWDISWKALRQRPAIAAAYARLGRDMPEYLLPETARSSALK